MLILVEKLDILRKAELGCPRCQFIMAMSYNRGMEYANRNDEEAVKFFDLARSYIKDNYPREEAEAMILDSEMDKFISVIDL